MFYRNKTEPKGAKAGASFATSCIPYLGDAKDIQEAVTGKDLITGKKLTGGERVLTITAAALPVVSGPMLKGAVKGGKVAVKEVPGAVKKAGTLIKKNAPKVKKAVKNTDVAEDTAKVLKEKAIKKVKDTNKVRKTVGKDSTSTKPNQMHHYATNKNKTYTPQLEEIANKCNLDLDDAWNKDLLPHQGRHSNDYHQYILDSMKQFDEVAQGDQDIFLKLYEELKSNVKNNPDMLYKNYWK